LTEFPTADDFDAANRGDLRSAVRELGGHTYWAEVIGLPLPLRRQRTTYGEDDAIRDALTVVSSKGHLPGEPTLRRMGYGRLATRVRQTPGGAEAFAAQHKLLVRMWTDRVHSGFRSAAGPRMASGVEDIDEAL
jgi:hypothetical protein